jgi:hypothetical protein
VELRLGMLFFFIAYLIKLNIFKIFANKVYMLPGWGVMRSAGTHGGAAWARGGANRARH